MSSNKTPMVLGVVGGGLALSLILFFTFVGFAMVEPGNVGIVVNLYGRDKGVQDYTMKTGMVIYSRFTQRVYEFPTYMQNVVWTSDVNEGSPANEEVTFNSAEGAVIKADVGISYQIDADKIPVIFTELRQDAEYIKHVYMRMKVRDAINRAAITHKASEIYGEKKAILLDEVKKELSAVLRDKGFIIDTLAFVGELRVESSVKDSINLTITATQKAIEAQNKVLQSKAEADQKIETARGEAESITIRAEANAKANELLTKSVTPELLLYQAVEKWDGVLPTVVSDSTSQLITLPQFPKKTE
jgi:regulator of protease activity HflC (stomatin/prohibitin superfamily)